MIRDRRSVGGAVAPPTRRLLVLAAVSVLVAGAAIAWPGGRGVQRGPISVPNVSFAGYEGAVGDGASRLLALSAPEKLVFDTIAPDAPARLLWLEGRAAQPTGDGAMVLDGAGGVIRFDHRLHARRVPLRARGREIIDAIPAAGGGVWAADANGEILRIDSHGDIRSAVAGPFTALSLAADPSGAVIWVARSPRRFAYLWATGDEPLLGRFETEEARFGNVGAARLPEHVLLSELANAGHLTARGDRIFYAPFIRDELVALSADGDTLWVLRRGLVQSIEEPRFELDEGRPVIAYHPVNLGLTQGADGLLYLLSTPGFTTTESRLDVIDPESGRLLRSGTLPTATPTLASDERGRVYVLDPFRLLTGVAPDEREDFPPFDLPRLDGGRISSHDMEGRVALLNFWASWCAPCRDEMPELDALRKSIPDPEFAFIAMNEDQQPETARAFLDELGFDFPVALGRGALKARYRYIGLPFTVLLDREGRVVQRWTGYGGEAQMSAIRAAAMAELARPGQGGGHEHPAAHAH